MRITGNGLIVGAILVVWWLMAAASGAAYFETIDGLITSILGDIVMSLSVLALWYHALGGVRHLVWDTGRGLDVETIGQDGLGHDHRIRGADRPDPSSRSDGGPDGLHDR